MPIKNRYFSRTFAEDLLSGEKLNKIIHKLVLNKMDSRLTEQDRHQKNKRIYDTQMKIKEVVKENIEYGL